MLHQSRSNRLKSEIRALALGSALLAVPFATALAATTLPPISIGAGVRTSFAHSEVDVPNSQDVDDFELNSARIYLSGKITENISLMFNTEYSTSTEAVSVLDAVAQFSFSDHFNIWAGRFIAPSDRANLYGPYYANHWGVYKDGIQDGYPSEVFSGGPTGRDTGVMYWGQFGIFKVSAGVFDVPATTGNTDVLTAARLQADFWDAEDGYYLNGTYYGEKDLLAIGIAAEAANNDKAYSVDFLLEKKLGGAGVITIESQYAKYEAPQFGYPSPRTGVYETSEGFYVLGAYILPADIGVGKLQFLVKVAAAEYDYATNYDVDQGTLELNINYLIKQFNARISAFYIDTEYEESGTGTVPILNSIAPDGQTYGIGLQVQM